MSAFVLLPLSCIFSKFGDPWRLWSSEAWTWNMKCRVTCQDHLTWPDWAEKKVMYRFVHSPSKAALIQTLRWDASQMLMGNKFHWFLQEKKKKKDHLTHQDMKNGSSDKFPVKGRERERTQKMSEKPIQMTSLCSVPKVNPPLKWKLPWALASFTASLLLRGVKDRA